MLPPTDTSTDCLALLAAEVRAGLVADAELPADPAQIGLDEYAVAEHQIEEARVAHDLDDLLHPMMEAVERVDAALDQERPRRSAEATWTMSRPPMSMTSVTASAAPAAIGRSRDGGVPWAERKGVVASGQHGHRIGDHGFRQRAGDGDDEGEPHGCEQPAPRRRNCRLVGEAEAGRRLFGRRAGIALSLRHPLSALQRRSMAELAEVADRRANVEDALLADIGVPADLDFARMNAVAGRDIAGQQGATHHDRILADLEKIGRNRDDPRGDDRVTTDPGAEQTQIHVEQRRSGEDVGGRRADDELRRPETKVGEAP